MTPKDAFEIVDHNDVLQILPRHIRPVTDDLIIRVRHRTTGGGRAALLTRAQASELRDWLDRWIREGWDGVEIGQQP